jgi:hypothetical protein
MTALTTPSACRVKQTSQPSPNGQSRHRNSSATERCVRCGPVGTDVHKSTLLRAERAGEAVRRTVVYSGVPGGKPKAASS